MNIKINILWENTGFYMKDKKVKSFNEVATCDKKG